MATANGTADYPLPAFHFTLVFAGDSGADTAFQEVSGIGTELELEAVAEGGENRFIHQLPKAVKYPKLVLKRCVAAADSALVQWCQSVLENDYTDAIETRSVEVRLLNEAQEPVRVWSFSNAYPANWEVEAFNATKNEVAVEKIELAYSYSQRTV